jgi:hypothetical protein
MTYRLASPKCLQGICFASCLLRMDPLIVVTALHKSDSDALQGESCCTATRLAVPDIGRHLVFRYSFLAQNRSFVRHKLEHRIAIIHQRHSTQSIFQFNIPNHVSNVFIVRVKEKSRVSYSKGKCGLSGRAIIENNTANGHGGYARIGLKHEFNKLIGVRIDIVVVNLIQSNRILIGDLVVVVEKQVVMSVPD